MATGSKTGTAYATQLLDTRWRSIVKQGQLGNPSRPCSFLWASVLDGGSMSILVRQMPVAWLPLPSFAGAAGSFGGFWGAVFPSLPYFLLVNKSCGFLWGCPFESFAPIALLVWPSFGLPAWSRHCCLCSSGVSSGFCCCLLWCCISTSVVVSSLPSPYNIRHP